MVSDEQRIECVIDMQASGLCTYFRNLVELESAVSAVSAIAEDDGSLVESIMKLLKVRTEIEK